MKKKWTVGLLVAGVLAAVVAGQQISSRDSMGIFYRVSGGKNKLYLLGSIHVGSRDMYPMTETITQAVDNADVIVFECDTTSAEAQSVTSRMMISQVPLNERISTECIALVEKAAAKLGYSMEYLQNLDPWAVTSMMTVAAASDEMDGVTRRSASFWGVENFVRRQLKDQRIVYLETAEYQLGLMENFSHELQEYLLSSACETVLNLEQTDGTDQDVANWPQWWKEGNAEAFANSYISGLEKEKSPELAKEYHQALLAERNRNMALKFQEMLETGEGKSYVGVVGLMHLVLPDDSVLALLESMGYQIEQIRN